MNLIFLLNIPTPTYTFHEVEILYWIPPPPPHTHTHTVMTVDHFVSIQVRYILYIFYLISYAVVTPLRKAASYEPRIAIFGIWGDTWLTPRKGPVTTTYCHVDAVFARFSHVSPQIPKMAIRGSLFPVLEFDFLPLKLCVLPLKILPVFH